MIGYLVDRFTSQIDNGRYPFRLKTDNFRFAQKLQFFVYAKFLNINYILL